MLFSKNIFFMLVIFALGANVLQATSVLPDGSYKKTCRTCEITGTDWSSDLECTCYNDTTKQWRPTALKYNYCRDGGIKNMHGILRCAGPKGPYRATCKNCEIKGTNVNIGLDCTCKNGNKWVVTSLSAPWACKTNSVRNEKGQLHCDRLPSFGGGDDGDSSLGSQISSAFTSW